MATEINSLKTHGELIAEERLRDEEFRAEWERLAFARAVAVRVIGYRADNGLSQRDLAKDLGVTQPQVARLEAAEHEPSDKMLRRLTTLGMEFTISYAPAGREPKLITKRARESAVAEVTRDNTVVRYAAA
jgi:transcriptional regulator with XRE-family HTH domain